MIHERMAEKGNKEPQIRLTNLANEVNLFLPEVELMEIGVVFPIVLP